MKIFIYVHNEDIADLKPLAQRLRNKGSQVSFYALKFGDADVRADQILTLPHYKKEVEALFAGRNIPIHVIEEEAEKPVLEQSQAEEPTVPVLTIPAVEEVKIPEVLPPPADTDEIVVMSVNETPAKPAPARPRKI